MSPPLSSAEHSSRPHLPSRPCGTFKLVADIDAEGTMVLQLGCSRTRKSKEMNHEEDFASAHSSGTARSYVRQCCVCADRRRWGCRLRRRRSRCWRSGSRCCRGRHGYRRRWRHGKRRSCCWCWKRRGRHGRWHGRLVRFGRRRQCRRLRRCEYARRLHQSWLRDAKRGLLHVSDPASRTAMRCEDRPTSMARADLSGFSATEDKANPGGLTAGGATPMKDNVNRRAVPNPIADRAGSYGAKVAATIVAIVVLSGVLLWTPWRHAEDALDAGPSSVTASSVSVPPAGAAPNR